MNDPSQQPTDSSIKDKITPKVAGAVKTGKYITVIVFAIIAVILGRGLFTEPVASKLPTQPEVTTASTVTTPLNLEMPPTPTTVSSSVTARVELPAPKMPTLPLSPPPSVLPTANAPKLIEETRLKSPTLVFGQEAKLTDANRSNGPTVANGDPNTLFAQQAANTQVVTVTAKQNTNVNYKILQGKLISAVLETSINSDMPGMVRAVVNKDVYSDTGFTILLPRGTRLIGQYNSSVAVGQTRVMVVWTRAITPEHIDIALGSPNADSLGQAGMAGDVDSHFWQIFGNSALLSILGVAASNVNPGSSSGELGVVGNPYQLALTQGMMNASNNVLQSRINIQPTIRVQQGSVIQVFVARDLDFSKLK